MSWKLDPFKKGQDAFQISWNQIYPYAFPPFALIVRVLENVQEDHVSIILITPAWQTQSWFPALLRISVRTLLFLPETKYIFKDPAEKYHPLIQQNSLKLVA